MQQVRRTTPNITCRLFPFRGGSFYIIFIDFKAKQILCVLIFLFRITESATPWHHLITLVEMVEKNKLWTVKVPMPTWNGFPYHFPISYFHAAEQAQCKFCQDLRWIGLCLCVYVRLCLCLRGHASLWRSMRVCVCVCVSVCKKYIYQGWAAVLFHFIFLFTHSVFQDGMKLKVYSFGSW